MILIFLPFLSPQRNYSQTGQSRTRYFRRFTCLIPDELYPRVIKELCRDSHQSIIIPLRNERKGVAAEAQSGGKYGPKKT